MNSSSFADTNPPRQHHSLAPKRAKAPRPASPVSHAPLACGDSSPPLPRGCRKETQDGHPCPSIMGSTGDSGYTFCDIYDSRAVARLDSLTTARDVHPAPPVCNAGVYKPPGRRRPLTRRRSPRAPVRLVAASAPCCWDRPAGMIRSASERSGPDRPAIPPRSCPAA